MGNMTGMLAILMAGLSCTWHGAEEPMNHTALLNTRQ